MNLLNYTGLIINGLVAFILPLLLSLHASPVPLTNNATENSEEESRVPFRQPSLQQPTLPSSTEVYYHSHEDTGIGGACQNYLPRSIVGKLEEGASGGAESDSTSSLLPSQPDRLSLSREDEEEEAQSALPTILLPYRREIILFIIASYMVIIGSTVVNNTYNLLSNS